MSDIYSGPPKLGDSDNTILLKIWYYIYGLFHGNAGAGIPTGLATSANQTTEIARLTSILAKIITAPATEAKQDTGNTSLASILAKIIAAPATEAKQGGVPNVNVAQVATSTAAATLAIARVTRRGLLVRNLDDTISVYIGPATVTSGNGMLLKAGESLPVTWVGLWQVIAASGTPTVAIIDEYD